MPYDELGNYIPGDDTDLDRMRYELSLADTVKQMVKSPANDLSMLTKPQTYKDIATGFGSAAESLVRGAGAVPFGLPGDIIKHFQETPLIPGVTDKLSINDIFPGYDTVQEAVAPTPFALPQRQVPNMSVAPERPKQELFGLPYVTTGDILQTAQGRYTPQFGDKEANDFMESLGMFLSPQMAAGARTGIINMVETTGRMPSLGRESAQAFARDYANAMNGVYPETPTAGSMAADFARTGKRAAQKTSEVIGETIEDLAQRRAAGEGAYANPFSPQSVMADIVTGPRSYAVRPVNAGQMLKETDLPNFKYVEANPKIHTVGYKFEEDALPYVGEEFPNTVRAEYYRNIFDRDREIDRLYQDWAANKYMEMFPDAPNVDAARRAYSNQGNLTNRSEDQLRMMSEFAESPEVNTYLDQKATERDLAIEEYNKVKNTPKSELKTDEAKDLHKARIDELELDLLKKDFAPELSSEEYRARLSIPTADEYTRRANAARKYIMGEMRNDIAKYVGTSQGPQMELAKRGVTIPEKTELIERSKRITQGGQDFRDLQKRRQEAGFNPLGEMQPMIIQKEAELAEQQKQLNELNAQRNSLREQHQLAMPEEPDPAHNPTEIGAQYRALKNPMSALIEKMTKNKKQLENFQLANAYETMSDMAVTPYPAKHWREVIPYEQRHFFPDLFAKRENGDYKIPDNAPMFNVNSGGIKALGFDFLAEQYTNAILDGRVPIDEKGKPTISVEKFIEQITKPRLKEAELKELEEGKSQIRLNDYSQRTLSSIPPDLRFKNASVVELTKDNPIDVIRRQISFDGMVLDNCVAATDAPHPGVNPFTNERYDYSYPVDPATGAKRGERVRDSSYMTAIHEGKQRYASIRDNVSGLPVVNINMLRTSESGSANPKYNVQYVSGYQNHKIDKKYTDDVRDYLNARADIIQGSGTGIDKWGIYDLNTPGGQTAASNALGVPKTALSSFDLSRFVTEKDLRDLASKQPVGESHADLVAARSRASQELQALIREHGIGSPETQDVANQLVDLEARLNAISTQVRTAPSTQGGTPNLFRRMTTEALTNGAIQEAEIGTVRARIDNLLNEDTYGLRELWSDDYEFYPIALRNFINGVRNGDNLPATLTNRVDMSAFATQSRDRLARFQANIQDFTPMQRELFVRELDNYAETNINQLAENLDPDNPTAGLEQIDDTHPGTIQYLRDIETRRRGQDFQPEAQARPALGAPTNVPRDIAEQITPRNYLNRDNVVQQIAERLNNSVRSLPEDRETLMEAWQQYQRNPSDIPGGILMVLPPENRNESVRTISNYMVQQIQNRLGGLTPEGGTRAAPALPPVNDPSIVSLANDIVAPNAAFRNQTVDDIGNAVREQLLPSIGIYNPNNQQDRWNLERLLATYQGGPLDVDLGQRLETFIQNNPARENQIRESIADFMINQIQTRLGNRAPAPQEPPAQTALTVPQIQDVVNREVERQSQILNLRPVNLDAFRYDMEQALQNTRADDILNALEELHVNYVNAREEGLASAASTVLNDLARLNNNAQRQAPQGVPQRSTAVMNAASDITQTLYTEARDNNFEMRDLTSTLHALDAGNFDHPMIRALPEADRVAVQQDIAASMRLLLQNQNINIPPDIFADGIPGAAPQVDHRIDAYRDNYTNELTGSRRAFDEVMQAERMTPGAINEAILRTDGDAVYRQEIMDFYRVDSPLGVRQLNNALRRYMEGNGFDVPPLPRAIDQLEARYPARENEFVYDPDDMANEIDYEMERQERQLTRNQYGRLEDVVEEIQRESGENFEDLIDAIDRMRMRQGIDGDVDLALGDIRARLIRNEERERLEFDRLQRNRQPAVVEPEAALQGALDGATHIYGPQMGREIQDLVDNLQNDDIRFDREPDQFIARLRDESNEYDGHNQGYSDAVGEMADFLENYMRERAANRPAGHKRGGYIKKMKDGGDPVIPDIEYEEDRKPSRPFNPIAIPYAAPGVSGAKFNRAIPLDRDNAVSFSADVSRRQDQGGTNFNINEIGGGYHHKVGPGMLGLTGSHRMGTKDNRLNLMYAIPMNEGGKAEPVSSKQIMNSRNINYNADGKVSVDEMRYELLRKK